MKCLRKVIAFMLLISMILPNVMNVGATEVNNENDVLQENQQVEQSEGEETDDLQGKISDESNLEQENEDILSVQENDDVVSETDIKDTYSEEKGNSDTIDGPQENSWRYDNGKLIEGIDNYSEQGKARSAQNTSSVVGIDVSEHQGVINWDQVKASGTVDFVLIRCGYGQNYTSQDDVYWQRNVSECERLGIPYGVYLYSYAKTTAEAESEAAHVLRLIAGKNLSYPVYYDMEDKRTIGSNYAAIAQTFCNAISSAGYEVGVYASLSWWNDYLTDPVFDNWDRWVAQWNSTCDYQGEYSLWQYTSQGSVPGISGNVDMNYWMGLKINGLLWQLRDTGIDVGVSYRSSQSNVQFKWQAYNLDSQKWEVIADWNGGNWATWVPRKGNYWLHVEVKNSDQTVSETICFAVGRNYPAYITGKYQGPNPYGEGWLLGVSSNINPGQNYQYEMLILDCGKYVSGDPNPWIYGTGLAKVSSGTTFWTTYKPPHGGYYWTYFRVYDDMGNMIEDQCYGALL